MSDKKSKKKGRKYNRDERLTLGEAFIGFQLQVKQNALEELKNKTHGLEEDNIKHKKRNSHLKEEQLGHIKTLLRQAREQEKELEQRVVINKEQVEQAMKEKWELEKKQENQLEELQSQISDLEQTVLEQEREKLFWLEYKNVGSMEHAKQIQLLESELKEMHNNFDEMSGQLLCNALLAFCCCCFSHLAQDFH
uniref:Uncharacterized protein n=1 Tax=Latimeria chalumnae TaxID=7897 RepID=M3XJZ4_LATCH